MRSNDPEGTYFKISIVKNNLGVNLPFGIILKEGREYEWG